MGVDPVSAVYARSISHSLSSSFALAQQDRASQRDGVELRHPFLDVRLLDFLLAIPPEERVAKGLVKPVLRRAMRGVVPTFVLRRRDKANFNDYVQHSLLTAHREPLRALFRGSRLGAARWVDEGAVDRALGGGISSPSALVSVIALELWLRGHEAPPPRALVASSQPVDADVNASRQM
jgi:asparagine synthase (glutamine-hydrolysing)